MRNKKQFLHVGLIAVVLGIATGAVAYWGEWMPEPASREAGRTWFVIWLTTAISIVIFSVVGAGIIYSVVKFRRKPDDHTDGPAIHGNTKLEIVWTLIPTLIVIALSTASAVVLHDNSNAGTKPERIQVIAQQYAWAFKYANGIQTGILRLPQNRHVELKLTSLDVIHSFWVPEFGQKQDTVPGQTFRLVISPTRIGTYPLICTELCGLGHSIMRTSAVVMPAGEYDKWLAAQGKKIAAASSAPGEAGKAVFTNNGCGACHTFKPAGSSGKVGPDLDNLVDAAKQANEPLEAFIRESIVDPNKVIAKGYPANVMPQTFSSLPKDQLDALVSYIAHGKEG